MKKAASALFTIMISFSFFVGCYGWQEGEIRGTLKVDSRSGWNELEFKDGKTGQNFTLKPGTYVIQYEQGIVLFRPPMIAISDTKGQHIGRLKIPKESASKDGSFEMYVGQKDNDSSFNILGGRRKIVLNRQRISKINAYCTHSEPTSCVNSKGELTTCYRDVPGTRDEVWEKVRFYNSYRIIFDAADLINVAVFTAEGAPQTEENALQSDSCR